MAKTARPTFRCAECGNEVAKWLGRCPECQAWGSIEERGVGPVTRIVAGAPTSAARPIGEVDIESARALSTGVSELDRVLGGGLVPGVVVLLAGEPGVGKSTLLLSAAHRWAEGQGPVLIVSGEESVARCGSAPTGSARCTPRSTSPRRASLPALLGQVDAVQPAMLIVDSVQTIAADEHRWQCRRCQPGAGRRRGADRGGQGRSMACVLVGHVTKDGAIAGPRVLEHLVDVVLQFEGDRHSTLRLVRGVKNRYGPADEVGCFQMRRRRHRGARRSVGTVPDGREKAVEGTCVTVIVEGKRPMLGEVQALVAKTNLPAPRRAVSGLDSARISMALAVLEKRGKVNLFQKDVFTATVGGMRLVEPAADLAVVLAVASAEREIALPADLVVLGEVGLAGEIRRVNGVGKRLSEAARLGFKKALVPPDHGPLPEGVRALVAHDLVSALDVLGLNRRGRGGAAEADSGSE